MDENCEAIILIAEDNEGVRFIQEQSYEMSELNYPIHFSFNGEELIEYLKSNFLNTGDKEIPRAVILLDLNMPIMDGREALKELKSESKFKDIPVIILTSSDSTEDKKLCEDLGVDDYITKPDEFEKYIELFNVTVRKMISKTEES